MHIIACVELFHSHSCTLPMAKLTVHLNTWHGSTVEQCHDSAGSAQSTLASELDVLFIWILFFIPSATASWSYVSGGPYGARLTGWATLKMLTTCSTLLR